MDKASIAALGAASQFWPPSESYNVAFLNLDAYRLSARYGFELSDLVQLITVSNAIRSLQRSDGSFTSAEASRPLLNVLHDVVLRLAESATAPGIGRFLRGAADNLMVGQRTLVELSQLNPPGSDLIFICGLFPTWDWKATGALHSSIVGTIDQEWTDVFDDLDQRLSTLGEFLGERCGTGTLFPSKTPRLIAAEILLCGGEADTYPKQFAHFLSHDTQLVPESKPGDLVLLFTNVYTARFRRLSLPLFECICGPLSERERLRASDPRWLLTWFKGHDVSHFWSLSRDRATTLPALADHDAGVLHEMLADVLGYLTLLGPWSPEPEPDLVTSGTAFLSEMLRYLRRGVGYFPDSSAAFMEQWFLIKNGFCRLDPETGLYQWTPEGLAEGLTQLGKRAVRAVLGGDESERQDLLRCYGPDANPDLCRIWEEVLRRTVHIPHDVGFQLA
ncbi:MAG TPA: hypothetical protein VMW75_27190 [Thermoanaerobaculia bacterium]|nr:hypothetical protein [Thermoanaerobaculia bacterium]